MAYSFEFLPDASRSLVEIKMSGFFSKDAVPSLAAGMDQALGKLRCGLNCHMTLIDVTGCKIQAQEIVIEFQRLVAHPSFRSRRLAFVTGSSLIKMQLRRIIYDDSYARIFGDRNSALAWLESQRGPAVKPSQAADFIAALS